MKNKGIKTQETLKFSDGERTLICNKDGCIFDTPTCTMTMTKDEMTKQYWFKLTEKI
jgi:hypothetical protein